MNILMLKKILAACLVLTKDASYAGSWKSGLVRYVHVLQWLLHGATAKLVR
jgi:hypothetical protein